jgi:hypothetical protein
VILEREFRLEVEGFTQIGLATCYGGRSYVDRLLLADAAQSFRVEMRKSFLTKEKGVSPSPISRPMTTGTVRPRSEHQQTSPRIYSAGGTSLNVLLVHHLGFCRLSSSASNLLWVVSLLSSTVTSQAPFADL